MDLGALTGIAILCTNVPIGLVVMVFAYTRRSLPGARAFMAVVGLALWWSIGYGCESLVSDLDTKIVCANLQFVSVTLLPVALLTMALRYTGRGGWLSRSHLLALCLVPLTTNVLLWADSTLMRASVWLDTAGSFPVIGRSWGHWFWFHAAYSYLLLTLTVVALVAAMLSRPRLRHRRHSAVLIGALMPIAGSLLETFLPSSSPVDDFTPGLFTLSILILAWGLLRVRIFNLVPVARHTLVENMRDGLLVLSTDEQVVDINESARMLIGLPKARILGRPLSESWEAWEQIASANSAGAGCAQLALQVEGNQRHYEVRFSPLAQHGQIVAHMLVLSDITERVLLEDSLRNQALTDSLTGLPNRALFMSRLGDAIRQSRRHDENRFAVIMVDLDRFKLVNDTLGHTAGDVLLQSVATKLSRCIREADTVARLGGDEFIILLHAISSQRDLLPVLTRIRSELRAPVYFGRQEMTAVSSMGIVIWDPSHEDPEEIVRAADTAMYQAKEDGRDSYRIFDKDMHDAVLRSLGEEADLRNAIQENDFSVVYQPVMDLKNGKVQSLEALLRWQHPERGTIFPRDFLVVAENSGLITALGEIAMDEVFRHVHHWGSREQRAGSLPMRVNISPRQLVEADFVPGVLSRLAAWRVPPERLILEITENALARDPSKARQAMNRLRELGVRLCLDDSGSGRSSLQHLTTFPVQDLKIDSSYVSGIAPGSRELEVVRHISALAHTLDLEVIAEGVETAEQWELVREAGCDLAQGYFIASPMEFDEALEFLRSPTTTDAGRQAKSSV